MAALLARHDAWMLSTLIYPVYTFEFVMALMNPGSSAVASTGTSRRSRPRRPRICVYAGKVIATPLAERDGKLTYTRSVAPLFSLPTLFSLPPSYLPSSLSPSLFKNLFIQSDFADI